MAGAASAGPGGAVRDVQLIGYRSYDHAGTAPRFAFGHGLGYTTWE